VMFLCRPGIRSPFRSRIWWCEIAFLAFTSVYAVPVSAETVFRLDPFIQVSEMFDDNVGLTAKNRQKDLVTNSLLGFDLNFDSNQQFGRLQYLGAFQKFAEHPEHDEFGSTQSANFSDQIKVTPSTTLSVADSFIRAGASSGLLIGLNPTLSPQLAVALLSNQQSVGNYGEFSLNHQWSERWSTSLRVNQSYFESGTTGSSFVQGAVVQEDYRSTADTHIGLAYEFDDMRSSQFPRSEAHFPRVYLNWTATPTLKFTAEGGPIAFQNSHAISLDPGFRLTGAYSLRRLKVQVRGGQTPTIGASFSGAGLVRNGEGSVSYALSRRTSLLAGVGFYQFTGNNVDAQVLSYGIGASYKVTRQASIFVDGWRIQQSGGTGLSSTSNATSSSDIFTVGILFSFEAFRGGL
jgi:hypothetical protein